MPVTFTRSKLRSASAALALIPLMCACINDDGDLSTLPETSALHSIRIRAYSESRVSELLGSTTMTDKQIVINWSGEALVFPYPVQLRKTTVTVDSESISGIEVELEDGKKITESFEYLQGELVKAKRVDTWSGKEFSATFHYVNKDVDSVGISMKSPGVPADVTGFFKKIAPKTFISIFPFNPKLSFSLEDQGFHQTGNIGPLPSENYYHTWKHEIPDNADGSSITTTARGILGTTPVQFRTLTYVTGPLLTDNFADFYGDREFIMDRQGYKISNDSIANTPLTNYLLFAPYVNNGSLPDFKNNFLINQVFLLLDLGKMPDAEESVSHMVMFDYKWKQ